MTTHLEKSINDIEKKSKKCCEDIQKLILNQQRVDMESKHIAETAARIEKKIDDFIKGANDKFSGKWVEKGAKVAIGSVLGTILLTLLGTIIIN